MCGSLLYQFLAITLLSLFLFDSAFTLRAVETKSLKEQLVQQYGFHHSKLTSLSTISNRTHVTTNQLKKMLLELAIEIWL